MSIGLGVFFSLALYFWLNRQINQLLDAYLKNLYADFAAETSNLAKNQILQQAATAMLAQANASKNSILTLVA